MTGEGRVWIQTTHGFVQGTYLRNETEKSEDSSVLIRHIDGSTVLTAREMVFPRDKIFGHRDNASLTFLNAPNLLENVAQRYNEALETPEYQGHIYTFTGYLLIAVNPYRPLPGLYNDGRLNCFPGKAISTVDPHPFAVAEAAYNALIKQWASQSIIISGESGAGKTECSKHVLKYLAFISDRRHDARNQGVEYRVLQSNPILEAFGNAKTVRNHNSSRFGKLMKLHFSRNGRMLGASIQTYLLAKSRVCHVPAQERNYHVFYWLCKGARTIEREAWSLGVASSYKYLDCTRDGEGSTQLQDLRNSMESVGIVQAEQYNIFRVLAAILTLGNLTFIEIGDNNAAVLSEEKHHQESAAVACRLLGLGGDTSKEALERVLTTRKVGIEKEIFERIRDVRAPLSAARAKQTVDALARALYQLLFDYIVLRINQSLRGWELSRRLACHEYPEPLILPEEGKGVRRSRYIGVLDIFGFEDLAPFSPNSFEQLCINYANERLYHSFLHEFVWRDRQSYIDEGLVPPPVQAEDNKAVCLAICGTKSSPGIFELLDESSTIPTVGSKDEFFCRRVHGRFADKNRIIVRQKTCNENGFTVCHYAGEVTYTTEGFNERNVDIISNELREFLIGSCDDFISSELCRPLTRDAKRYSLKLEPLTLRPSTASQGSADPGAPAKVDNEKRLTWEIRTGHPPKQAFPLPRRETPFRLQREQSVSAHQPRVADIVNTTETFVFDESTSEDSNDEEMRNLREGRKLDRDSRLALGKAPPQTIRSSSCRLKGKQNRRKLEQGAKSLSSLFAIQVEGLIASLARTSSFFIRCIKPNDMQRPSVFNRQRVLQQLTTGGMVAVLQLMGKGYPCRIRYSQLWDMYSTVLPSAMSSQMSPKDFTEIVLRYIKTRPEDYKLGHSRAFFKFGALQQVEKISEVTDMDEKQKIAQSAAHFWLKKKQARAFTTVLLSLRLWLRIRRGRARKVADAAREYFLSTVIPRRVEKFVKLTQRWWRCTQLQRRFRTRRNAALQIQSAWRGFVTRCCFARLLRATIVIQAAARATIGSSNFALWTSQRRAAIRIQDAWREFSTRKQKARLDTQKLPYGTRATTPETVRIVLPESHLSRRPKRLRGNVCPGGPQQKRRSVPKETGQMALSLERIANTGETAAGATTRPTPRFVTETARQEDVNDPPRYFVERSSMADASRYSVMNPKLFVTAKRLPTLQRSTSPELATARSSVALHTARSVAAEETFRTPRGRLVPQRSDMAVSSLGDSSGVAPASRRTEGVEKGGKICTGLLGNGRMRRAKRLILEAANLLGEDHDDDDDGNEVILSFAGNSRSAPPLLSQRKAWLRHRGSSPGQGVVRKAVSAGLTDYLRVLARNEIEKHLRRELVDLNAEAAQLQEEIPAHKTPIPTGPYKQQHHVLGSREEEQVLDREVHYVALRSHDRIDDVRFIEGEERTEPRTSDDLVSRCRNSCRPFSPDGKEDEAVESESEETEDSPLLQEKLSFGGGGPGVPTHSSSGEPYIPSSQSDRFCDEGFNRPLTEEFLFQKQRLRHERGDVKPQRWDGPEASSLNAQHDSLPPRPPTGRRIVRPRRPRVYLKNDEKSFIEAQSAWQPEGHSEERLCLGAIGSLPPSVNSTETVQPQTPQVAPMSRIPRLRSLAPRGSNFRGCPATATFSEQGTNVQVVPRAACQDAARAAYQDAVRLSSGNRRQVPAGSSRNRTYSSESITAIRRSEIGKSSILQGSCATAAVREGYAVDAAQYGYTVGTARSTSVVDRAVDRVVGHVKTVCGTPILERAAAKSVVVPHSDGGMQYAFRKRQADGRNTTRSENKENRGERLNLPPSDARGRLETLSESSFRLSASRRPSIPRF